MLNWAEVFGRKFLEKRAREKEKKDENKNRNIINTPYIFTEIEFSSI